MTLEQLGFDSAWREAFAPHAAAGLSPARVVLQLRDRCVVDDGAAERGAVVSGRFRHDAAGPADFPAIGDWVAIESAGGDGDVVIQAVLPRRGAFVRKVAGKETEAQVVAANVDTVFLVTGMDGDFNLRRIERYLTAAAESGASPVVVLNKVDLRDDMANVADEVRSISEDVPIAAVSARHGSNLAALEPYLLPGTTIALLGSSGAGKSTLINRLLGEERLATAPVREDDSRGRHTTTHRELVALPGGALLVDTPGMRELQLWAGDEAVAETFGDIARLAAGCRFPDCSHEVEPGCAVREAVAAGALDAGRLESYLKQRRELRSLEIRIDDKARKQNEKKVGRRFAKMIKEVKTKNPKYK